jgi:hypothetical protein
MEDLQLKLGEWTNMNQSKVFLGAAAILLGSAAAEGAFTGPYAGGTWTVTAPVGGTAFFDLFGTRLTITGPDLGSSGDTDVTHAVVSGGTWSFNWDYSSINSDGFDSSYYLLNGAPTFLCDSDDFGPCTGTVTRVPVATGDTIGWRVNSADGVFGPGVLNVTGFTVDEGAGCVCDQEFQVGDKVELLEDFRGGPTPGSLGTVICGRFFDPELILVYWEDFLGGHDGFGACSCPDTGLPKGSTSGWYVPCDLLAHFKCPKNINFDGSPGTAAPPSGLGPYIMTPFPFDGGSGLVSSAPSPLGGSVGFAPALDQRQIGFGWATWSHGYLGDVYVTDGNSVTLTMPPDTGAFYLYVEPNFFGEFVFEAVANDGTTSGPISVEGFAGAAYFGFYAAGGALNSITVTNSDAGAGGFAVGEFGIAPQGQVIFDGSPGTAAPPAMLGPYVMDKFAADTACPPDDVTSVATPLGQPLFFSDSVSHRSVNGGPVSACGGWGTWSHGYTGDVYFQDDADTLTLIMPPQTGAFYMYVEPNAFGLFEFVVETDSGTSSGTVNIEGSAGATYFGFWGAGGGQIVSITVTNTDGGALGFAVGEFGIAEKACKKTCPADLDGNGIINGFDLAILLGQWTGAGAYAPCPPHKNADLNGDCKINGFDLAILLGLWGPCSF